MVYDSAYESHIVRFSAIENKNFGSPADNVSMKPIVHLILKTVWQRKKL
jgi:hypothetical protein